MPIYDVPGRGVLVLSIVVLDLNGTIAVDGQVLAGVAERVQALREAGFACYLVTADTRGRAQATAEALDLTLQRLDAGHETEQKQAFVEQLGAARVAAVGNGANDAGMLRAAAVGIAVIQAEGASAAALQTADIVVPDIRAALDLLLEPQRLIATLRH